VRTPKKRGRPIGDARIAGWRSRFTGYRQEVTPERIKKWVDQFSSLDRDIAARILDCLNYVTDQSIEESFRQVLKKFTGWNTSKKKRKGKWRFVAFSQSAGESGDNMLHRWRVATGMTGSQYKKLYIHRSDLLREQLGATDTVVFLDDFAGTGNQVCQGWRETMSELLPSNPTICLVLAAVTSAARHRIQNETPLRVLSPILLKDDNNIFSNRCQHFNRAEKDVLLSYCRKANKKIAKGYGDCGLLIVLAHKTPNNSIPILHSDNERWFALFPR